MSKPMTNHAATSPIATESATDRIEKTIELKASVSRVWRALTDHKEFGTWFRAAIDKPFAPGQTSRGQITNPGFEHLKFIVAVVTMEPERLFSYRWHPFPIDPDADYSQEEPTLVTFTLEPIASGTRLHVVEEGFDKIPAHRRTAAFNANSNGWAKQLDNIKSYADAP
jgi:uncharacterized protein YndB with AHSA1/START domain